MILVDTNVLYALADRRDRHHTRCAEWLRRTSDVLMVPATVLAETCYLIDRTLGPTAEAAFSGEAAAHADARFSDRTTEALTLSKLARYRRRAQRSGPHSL